MIPGPGLHAGFSQMGVSAFTMHNQYVPPVPNPLPNIPGLVEIPGFMATPVSVWTRKTATTVFFDGAPAVQEGHDMGFMIPHFAMPMNTLCAVHTCLSKHKIIVPVQKVKIQGQNMGSYMMFAPGQICADPVSLPTAVVMLLKCTVWTQVTLADIGAMVWTSIKDAALDALWNRFTNGSWAGTNPNASGIFRGGPDIFSRLGSRIFRGHPEVLAGLGDNLITMCREGGFRGVSNIVARTFGQELVSSSGSKALKDLLFDPVVTHIPEISDTPRD